VRSLGRAGRKDQVGPFLAFLHRAREIDREMDESTGIKGNFHETAGATCQNERGISCVFAVALSLYVCVDLTQLYK
jgi:hypothetical protein